MNAPQPVDTRAAIRAQGLTKRYGELLAVDGLDLDIPSGQFFGLLGPNGSGKTTTIHMLATLIRPTRGTAQVADFDVVRQATRAREAIGLVFQESALDRTLTVAENLRFAGFLQNLPARIIAERSRELLELFGLGERRDSPVAALSGGMRRALDIVRGVLHEPRILFLDEPTIGLDLPNRRRIWRFIERLRARTGMTVLLTTHYLEEADGCDRVAFIRAGKLVETGAPSELVQRLGSRIVEVEAQDLEALMGFLEPRLGPGLRDGEIAMFRCREQELHALAGLQADIGTKASAWRVRRPNLNDVFLWVAAGKALAR
ncbi:MAG TPA: ATP-binding cassette domain-containing protein [Burkholderiales bacterium]|jgi:ABC-2 type transport system ATP-binding protein|nr:ATP-binding cassette domain-containing protein [Burkholderiales bacterium]